jgi:hypothetical protein
MGANTKDSIVLTATGTRANSLSIVMTFFASGVVVHRHRWTSADELYDVDSVLGSPAKLALSFGFENSLFLAWDPTHRRLLCSWNVANNVRLRGHSHGRAIERGAAAPHGGPLTHAPETKPKRDEAERGVRANRGPVHDWLSHAQYRAHLRGTLRWHIAGT